VKRSAIKHRSVKGQEYEADYWAQMPLVHDRSGYRCEVMRHGGRCRNQAQAYPHHRKLRSQGGSNSLDNLLDVCARCHDEIHREMPRSLAVARGLIVPRDTAEFPYDPQEIEESDG